MLAKLLQLCPTLCDLMDCSSPDCSSVTSLSTEFFRQEYWSKLPCPTPGDLPDLGMELKSSVASALQADSLPLSHEGKNL